MIDTGPNGPKGPHRFTSFKLNFISAVDHPAQAPARALVVAKRDPSAPPSPEPHVMDPTQQLATVTSQLTEVRKQLGAILALTGAQLDHYKTLPEAGQASFLQMSDTVRNVEVQKALEADPVVVDLGDGVVVRKSAGAANIAIAKMAKSAMERANEQTLVAQAAVYKARVKEDLDGLPLTDTQAIELLVAVDTIKNDEVKTEILKALKAKSGVNKEAGQVRGVSGGAVRKNGPVVGGGQQSAASVYKAAVAKYAKEKNLSLLAAYDEYGNTEEGMQLRQDHEDEQRARENQL